MITNYAVEKAKNMPYCKLLESLSKPMERRFDGKSGTVVIPEEVCTKAYLEIIDKIDQKRRIRAELKQAIESGVIKIESGSDKLFEILKISQ